MRPISVLKIFWNKYRNRPSLLDNHLYETPPCDKITQFSHPKYTLYNTPTLIHSSIFSREEIKLLAKYLDELELIQQDNQDIYNFLVLQLSGEIIIFIMLKTLY